MLRTQFAPGPSHEYSEMMVLQVSSAGGHLFEALIELRHADQPTGLPSDAVSLEFVITDGLDHWDKPATGAISHHLLHLLGISWLGNLRCQWLPSHMQSHMFTVGWNHCKVTDLYVPTCCET